MLQRFTQTFDQYFNMSDPFPYSLPISLHCSLFQYAPNPGGGLGRSCSGTKATSASGSGDKLGRQSTNSCTLCSNSSFPLLEEICPFHHHRTQGLVQHFRYKLVMVVLLFFFCCCQCMAWCLLGLE